MERDLGEYLEIIIRDHDIADAVLSYGYRALIEYPQFRRGIILQISKRINSIDINDLSFLGTLVILKNNEKSFDTKAKFPTDPKSPISEAVVAFNIIRNIFEARTLQESGRDIDNFLRLNEEIIRKDLPLEWPF